MSEKILILGAGPGQLRLIKTAKDLGYYVIVVTIPGDYPGLQFADEILFEDIFNTDIIIEYAKNNQIKGVISDQSDMAAPLVGRIADALGLPSWGEDTALKFTDKIQMRSVFENLGLPVPQYLHATSLEEAKKGAQKIGYPLIIKPTDAFASLGVFKIYNEMDLEVYFPRSLQASKSKIVVVEELIKGEQYFCQGFVQNYELRLYAFSNRYYYDLPNVAIPYTNAFPAKISKEFETRMTTDFTKVVNHLRPLFGHVWAEWIYDEERDKLYIIEIAIRGAGAGVTNDLMPKAYGIDSLPYLINAAAGHYDKSFFDEKISSRSAAFFSFLLPEGIVSKIDGVDYISNIPGVFKVELKPIKIGDKIPPIENKKSRYGSIFLEGKNRDELDNILEKVKSVLNIEVKTKNGLKNIIWE